MTVREDPRFVRNRYHHRNYGRTHYDYLVTLREQNGGCALCDEPPKEGRVLAWDHDHDCCDTLPTCGQCTRGLLCARCNTTVAHVERLAQMPEYVAKIADYLAKT